jgi:hypothetical protein
VRSYPALSLAVLLVGVMCPGANAFGRDETQREQIRGDDDPIIVPRSVALPERPAFIDPETTGTIERRSVKPSQTCDRFAWYPERTLDAQFREVC